MSEKENPFTPGFGVEPPYFAGRKVIENKINQSLLLIKKERNKEGKIPSKPDMPYVLVGPRGVGKTVILNRAKSTAEKLNVKTIKIVKKEFNEEFGEIIKTLTESSYSFVAKYLKEVKLNLADIIKLTIRPDNYATILEHVLRAVMKKKGALLLLCDEVHEYDNKNFGDFANAIQDMLSESYPLSVIFAGTPILSTKLTQIHASFLDRSTELDILSLNREETKKAFSVPFDEHKTKINVDALDFLVSNSDYYPYFIQIIGRELWDLTVPKKINTVNLELAKKSLEISKTARIKYYDKRRYEIGRSPNRQCLIDIILYINKYKEVQLFELQEFIESKYKDINSIDAINELNYLGVILSIQGNIVQGIPSFFNFVIRNLKKPRPL